jgi:hypothetical protein
MRLKKKYTAIIVAMMVVLTAILASFIVNSVQGSRIAYVEVSADKASYGMDENVTFKLRPLSQDVQFTVSGMYEGAGVQIVRLPDSADPDTVLQDSSMLNNLSMWGSSRINTVIPIPSFNSTGEPLELTWNGTISAYDRGANQLSWGKASSGYYLLYPKYSWEYGHTVKFMLDRSSIFFYDSLRVDLNVTNELGQTATNTTITADLTLPQGAAPVAGTFSSFVPGSMASMDGNYSDNWHNFTVDLLPGVTTRITVSFPAQSYSQASMDAVVRSPTSNFIFGFWEIGYNYDGREEGVILVQY